MTTITQAMRYRQAVITGFYRFLRKHGQMAVKLPNPKYIPKPYEQMRYPGQRVQIDVKFAPESCIVGYAKGKKFYQYTAIDEYSRFRYVEAFEEYSSYSSAIFLEHMLKKFPYINFIHLKTLKINLLYTTENTIIFLCVL